MTTENSPQDTSVQWPETTPNTGVASDASMAPSPEAAPTALSAGTAPAVNPVRWSGKKTAVAAALALGLSTVGAVGVAAAHERGASTTPQDGRAGFPGGGGGPGGQGGYGPVPGTAASGAAEPAGADRTHVGDGDLTRHSVREMSSFMISLVPP
ncbi:hypothetical protein [Knoellia subterranea]|uniref:hypothetical protein n=1 Tax=Knoellia subterranea TaxID=184882 RepID=UPI0012EBDA82|nr:hypothetical protein [Knoellia subterranea]